MCAYACVCPSVWSCVCACAHVALLIQHVTRMRHIVTSFVSLWLHRIFRHYLINGTMFETQLLTVKYVFWFSLLELLSKKFLSKQNLARCHKCKNVFMGSARYSCRALMKLENSREIFEKSSNIKFHQNRSSGGRVVSCGRTVGHVESTRWFKYDRDKLWLVYTQIVPVIFEPPCSRRFSQFCERA